MHCKSLFHESQLSAAVGPKKANTGVLFTILTRIIAVSTPINNFAFLFKVAVCFNVSFPDKLVGFDLHNLKITFGLSE